MIVLVASAAVGVWRLAAGDRVADEPGPARLADVIGPLEPPGSPVALTAIPVPATATGVPSTPVLTATPVPPTATLVPPTWTPTNAQILAGDSVAGPPTLSAATIDAILAAYGSPAKGLGQEFYDAGVANAIDPAYGLAWFVHESRAGTRGVAPDLCSIGLLRAVPGADAQAGYALYSAWDASVAYWFERVSREYVQEDGLRTVAQIVDRYAGPDDPQDAASVASDITTLVRTWRRAQAGSGPMPAGPDPIPGVPPAAPVPVPPPHDRANILPRTADITSEFGHYPDGGAHYGLDLRASTGTPQVAPVGGVVLEVHRGCTAGDAACGRGWGNHVWWRSAETGHYILLAHFEQIAPNVQVGAAIRAGTVIGLTGMTGFATGPHVHIQVNPEGLADTGSINPAYEFPWLSCGTTAPQLGGAWGNETCP